MVAQQLGLVALGRPSPGVERGELRRRDPLVEHPLLEAVSGGEHLPVEVRPCLDIDEVGGVGHRLGAELGQEPDHPRNRRREPLDIANIAVIPTEVEVAVGAVEPREVGEDARVRHAQSGRVGSFE